jgi:hypothetical protein
MTAGMTSTTNTVDIFKISPDARYKFYTAVLEEYNYGEGVPYICLEVEFMKQYAAKRIDGSTYEFSNLDLYVEFIVRWA